MIRYLLPFVVAACSSANVTSMDASTDAPADASPMDSAPAETGGMCTNTDAGAQCNAVVQGASDTPLVATGMAIPTGTGGTFVEGRYFLTKFESYTGVMPGLPATLKQTIELCGGVAHMVESTANMPEKRKSFTYAPAGTQPNLSLTCSNPMGGINVPHSSYTASPTSFTLYSTMYLISFTFTKQ